MNSELLSNLKTCHSFLITLEEKIKCFSADQRDISDWNSKIFKLQDALSINNQIVLFIKIWITALIPMFFVSAGLVAGILSSANTPLACIIDVIISTILSVLIIIVYTQKNNQKISTLTALISSSQEKAKVEFKEIQELLNSPESLLTKSLIPSDYRKAYIVEKLIYFFRNGHVDNMKEAVHEYDNYRHTAAMEAAAEQSAIAAAQTALQAAKTAKNAEEIKLWTMLNTYINSSK